ncbi:MAG: transglycosylase SLT domain-containing protein [Myxococcaceae bacterium]|nr:transglycosylase SLT domain-containing protein [Myxococcaceae bacterium]
MAFPVRRSSSSNSGSGSDLGRRIADQVRSSVQRSAPAQRASPARSSFPEGFPFNQSRDVFEPKRPAAPVSLGTPAAPPAPPASSTGLDSTGDSAQVDGWIASAEEKMGRDFTAEEEEAIRIVAYYESRNDPNAVNDFDANAQAGNPSKGLMQVTVSNFNAYNPGGNIMDPVDNIVAAVRYADERYGGIDKSKGVVDLKNGGATDPYGGWNGGYTWY